MLINQEIHPKGDESGVLQEEGQFTWFVQGNENDSGEECHAVRNYETRPVRTE
jgi:hypothetical protein